MSTIVGRDRELETLGAFLERRMEHGRVLLLAGEAGIGKTTLWEEAVRRARDSGSCVLTSRASPAETRLAFAAIGDLWGDHIDKLRESLPRPQARALSVALLLAEAGHSPPEPSAIAFAV